ncbi:GNAT family N-acetyltransferase [Plantactinospora sp. B5E13]|uniref:GNAT family N-acetyltransferase n=1 Tax=unclassified Plantactinospora TaxID=2631981 RepID=UPI00325EF8D1
MSYPELPIEPATPADFAAIHGLLNTLFHNLPPDETLTGAEHGVFEPDRSLVVRAGSAVVAHAGAYTRDLTVPGAVLPAAHVTLVGVAPTHRRQGLLTRLMQRQLRQIQAAGRESFAVLWASEGPIYPRFGYGQATRQLHLDIRTTGLRLTPPTTAPSTTPPTAPTIRLHTGDPVPLWSDLAPLYDRLRADRPGWSDRTEAWWRYVLSDYPTRRSGGTERRVAVVETAAGISGYAVWRGRGHWDERGPQGSVLVEELVAADPDTSYALWRFLLSIDLTRTVSYLNTSTDEPLQYLVDEPRQLGARVGHGLWVRIVDVAGALTGRRYAADVDVVFEVTDPLLPENAGRWRLTADAGGPAVCVRTDAPADLVCDVRDLGAAYLGGPPLAALAAAGRVREARSGALARASTAFGWHRAPTGMGIF